MRKMKKINGYLVVRFNDREKRGYPQIGSFGVIDAELYTGHIDVDLSAFEYDDADTIEVAVEQARGLEAEQDYSQEPPIYTVTTETAEETKEEEIEPRTLIRGWEEQLKTHIKSHHYKDVDPRTAAHELYGYKVALCDLGLLDWEDRVVDPHHFGKLCELQDDDGHRIETVPSTPTTERWEEVLAYICDELCKYREGHTQEELDAICEKCKLGRRAADPPTLPIIQPEGEKSAPFLPWNKAPERITYRIVMDVSKLRDFHQFLKLLEDVEGYANGGKPNPIGKEDGDEKQQQSYPLRQAGGQGFG